MVFRFVGWTRPPIFRYIFITHILYAPVENMRHRMFNTFLGKPKLFLRISRQVLCYVFMHVHQLELPARFRLGHSHRLVCEATGKCLRYLKHNCSRIFSNAPQTICSCECPGDLDCAPVAMCLDSRTVAHTLFAHCSDDIRRSKRIARVIPFMVTQKTAQ